MSEPTSVGLQGTAPSREVLAVSGFLPFIARLTRCGSLLFTSGVTPRQFDTLTVPDGFDAQCMTVFANADSLLRTAGSSFASALSVTIYLADMANWDAMNDEYVKYIDQAAPPSRAAIEVKSLHLGYEIEVQVTAWAPQ